MQRIIIEKKKISPSRIFSMVILLITIIVTMFPIYWMLATSFKSQSEIYLMNPTLFPDNFTIDGYNTLLGKTKYLSGLRNSFLVAITVSTLTILLAVPCSYAISKLRFTGKKILSTSVLFTYLIPASVLYIPMYMMLNKLDLTNDLRGLMLIYPTITIFGYGRIRNI